MNSNNHSTILVVEVLKRDIVDLMVHINRIENDYVRGLSIKYVEALAKMSLKELRYDGLMVLKDLSNLFKNHFVYENMHPNE